MSQVKGTEIEGDVSVGRHIAVGGNVTTQGNASVKKNLKVGGWLEARNVKSANKGLFGSAADLREAYPYPHDGWFAGVAAMDEDISALSLTPQEGKALFRMYIGRGGEWVCEPLDKLYEISVDLSGLDEIREEITGLNGEVEDVRTQIGEYNANVTAAVEQARQAAASASSAATDASQSAKRASEMMEILNNSSYFKIKLFAGFIGAASGSESDSGYVEPGTLENNDIVFDKDAGVFKYVSNGQAIGASVYNYNSYTRQGMFVGLCDDRLFLCNANGKLYKAVNLNMLGGGTWYGLVEYNKVPSLVIDLSEATDEAFEDNLTVDGSLLDTEGVMPSLPIVIASAVSRGPNDSICTTTCDLTLRVRVNSGVANLSTPVTFRVNMGNGLVNNVNSSFIFRLGTEIYTCSIHIYPLKGNGNTMIPDAGEGSVRISRYQHGLESRIENLERIVKPS